jgi:hypothetical protein
MVRADGTIILSAHCFAYMSHIGEAALNVCDCCCTIRRPISIIETIQFNVAYNLHQTCIKMQV